MPILLDQCFHMSTCLDLCSLNALCYISCACALHAMFVCLNLGYVFHAMCYYSSFVALVAFSCVFAHWFGPDLDPLVFVIIHNPLPISKGLDHPFCKSMLACLYALSSVLASLILGYATFNALSGFVVVWLDLTPCFDVTTWDASPDAGLLRPYLSSFSLHAMICLPYLFVPFVGFLCIFTCLLTCPCFSLACKCAIHVSTQWSYGQTIQTYICPSRTPSFVCFFTCFSPFLFACLHASLFLCLPRLPCVSALCLFHMLFSSFPFQCLSTSFLYLPLHVHIWSKDTWS